MWSVVIERDAYERASAAEVISEKNRFMSSGARGGRNQSTS